MPADASSSSFIWRCVAFAGCSTQVRASATCVAICARLEVGHELLGRGAPAGDPEAHDAATALRQVLLRKGVLSVAFERGVAHPGDLRVLRQETRHGQAVLAMPCHAQMQAFQPHVHQERVLRRLYGAEVPHELGRRLRDEGAFPAEALGVHDAVIALVRLGEAGKPLRMGHPVEAARVHDGAAHARAVPVHVLGGGMRHDVGSPFDGAAQHRRGKRVVHDERHAMRMRRRGETLDVEHGERRVRDGFAEHGLRVGTERGLELRVGAVGRDERAFQAHAAHRVGQQVVGAAVEGGARHHVVARAGKVEHGEEIRRLARRREHARRAPFELGDLRGHGVVRGVREARVEIAGLFQVEQAAHVLARVELPGGGLVDGNLARLAVAGTVAALHAGGANGLAHETLLTGKLARIRNIITTGVRLAVTFCSDSTLSLFEISRSSDY